MTTQNQATLPEVDFQVSATGITISCNRLNTPRFVPFDTPGKCQNCKCDAVEISFAVSKDSIIICCPRMTLPKLIPFDYRYDLPNECIFRVKCKGLVFNIPCTQIIKEVKTEAEDNEQTSMQLELNQRMDAVIEEVARGGAQKTEKKMKKKLDKIITKISKAKMENDTSINGFGSNEDARGTEEGNNMIDHLRF